MCCCGFLIEHKKIAAISDWSISTQKRRIHIHYHAVFLVKHVDKNKIQFHGVLIKKYTIFSGVTHTLTHSLTYQLHPRQKYQHGF